MIETILPDKRGRVSLLPYLNMIGWKHGQAVKIDILETVELTRSDEPFIINVGTDEYEGRYMYTTPKMKKHI